MRVEGNKLIAEFLGAELYAPSDYDIHGCSSLDVTSDYGKHFFRPEQMKFDESWDWLMPVLKRISETLFTDYAEKEWEQWQMIFSPTKYPIQSVHNQVIEFIKWHKQNKETE